MALRAQNLPREVIGSRWGYNNSWGGVPPEFLPGFFPLRKVGFHWGRGSPKFVTFRKHILTI